MDLNSSPADLGFVRLSTQVGRRLDRSLRVDDLLTLWEVWRQGQMGAATLQPLLQRDSAHATHVLEMLVQHNILRQIDETTYQQAEEGGATKVVALVEAVMGLLDADGDPSRLGEGLEGIYAQIWHAIVDQLS